METRQVVFTDLDGTLIDFESYDGSVTRGRLRELVEAGVWVVFCSSKTLAEQRAWMASFGVMIPAIIENGAGIFIPDEISSDCPELNPPDALAVDGGRIIGFGATAGEILAALEDASVQLKTPFANYRSMDVDEVARRTGLDPDAAARARSRDFSETLTAPLDADQLDRLNAFLAERGLHAVCGGRFHTITSRKTDKGTAIRWLLDHLARAWPTFCIVSTGIGDAANDLPMLRAVDRPCLVQRPDGHWNDLDTPGLLRIPAIGPHGWLKAVAPL